PTDRIDRLGATDPVGITGVDVGHVLDAKRRAIAAHASQVLIDDFMGIPAGAFERVLATEWYVPVHDGSGRLLADLGHGLPLAS
ncbi:MAG: hypothetical protein S0880_16545, partial [Actinomycetota bacterium]|nr:hypothetical protein [Actinomycetota bacterium]